MHPEMIKTEPPLTMLADLPEWGCDSGAYRYKTYSVGFAFQCLFLAFLFKDLKLEKELSTGLTNDEGQYLE